LRRRGFIAIIQHDDHASVLAPLVVARFLSGRA
jgi:hypothetical protein